MRSSSIFRDRLDARRALFWLLTAAAFFVQPARAVDPARAMSQYIRDRWGREQGFPRGPVYAMTQTPDGYLWIGAEAGLIRFDGFSFRLIDSGSGPLSGVLGLASDDAGDLWVRLVGPTLLRYRGGVFENAMSTLGMPYSNVTVICRGNDGGLLVARLENGALSYHAGKFQTLAAATPLARSPVIAMAQTTDGDLWMGTRDAGLFRVRGDQVSAVSDGLPDSKVNCLLPAAEGKLWVGTDRGIAVWDGARLTTPAMPDALRQPRALAMAGDRDGNVWVGTNSRGLLRLNAQGVASLADAAGEPNEAVTALFEDREGSIWIGSAGGIERLRDSVFVTYSAAQGLPSDSNGPLYVDGEGRTWFAPIDGGLYWMRNGQIGRVTQAGLDSDVVYSLDGRQDELWVGRQRGGLTRLRLGAGSFEAATYTRAEGLAQNSVYAVHENRDGTVWAGTLSGGVSSFHNGRFTTYTAANGLSSNTVAAILEGADGTMWFATPNGLSALSGNRWRVYKASDGLPSDNLNCLLQDSAGVIWIGTAAGLAFLKAGAAPVAPRVPDALQQQILGMAEDGNGSLWIATLDHVLQVQRDKLLAGELADDDVHEYGLADGLQGVEGVKRQPSVVTDGLGRIWFSMNRGLSVVNPGRLRGTAPPAIVHIQTLSADGSPVSLRGGVRVPARSQRVMFGFAGLSLSVPERVQFRYRLDGFDHDWSAPSTTREAIYTNLTPGAYRFRVIASNPDGVWNGAEEDVAFEVEPALWQTWWFRLALVLALAGAVAALYRLRLLQLTHRLNVRFEERLTERTRIAQELHDTLLQGFLSASMQLHLVSDEVPEDSPARTQLNRVLQLMGQVIDEGRNALRGLRSPGAESLDLEQAFSRVSQDLPVDDEIEFRVIVEGRLRALHPMLRDEVYRIGREAIVNAFRHSGAKNIEVEIEYAARRFRCLVRDNGRGIDPKVLQQGRDGHWGLPGMRERAERIGGRLSVWSGQAAGTEVELSVPGHVAFPAGASPGPLRWLWRLSGRARESDAAAAGGRFQDTPIVRESDERNDADSSS